MNAVDYVLRRFRLTKAIDYIVGEKLVNFLDYQASIPDFKADLPLFGAEIQRRFTPRQLREYFAEARRLRGGSHRHQALLPGEV